MIIIVVVLLLLLLLLSRHLVVAVGRLVRLAAIVGPGAAILLLVGQIEDYGVVGRLLLVRRVVLKLRVVVVMVVVGVVEVVGLMLGRVHGHRRRGGRGGCLAATRVAGHGVHF